MSSRLVQSPCGYTDCIYEPVYHHMRNLHVMYIIILSSMHSYESQKMSLKSYLFISTLNDDIMKVAMNIKPIRNTHFVSEETLCYLLIITVNYRVHMSSFIK
jgi:hypothetical protein